MTLKTIKSLKLAETWKQLWQNLKSWAVKNKEKTITVTIERYGDLQDKYRITHHVRV